MPPKTRRTGSVVGAQPLELNSTPDSGTRIRFLVWANCQNFGGLVPKIFGAEQQKRKGFGSFRQPRPRPDGLAWLMSDRVLYDCRATDNHPEWYHEVEDRRVALPHQATPMVIYFEATQ